MTRAHPRAATPATPDAELLHPVTVHLTAREIAALIGRGPEQRSVAICVTSADDEHHRVNHAEAALRRFVDAVRDRHR